MATVEPFAALRPRPDLARAVCELPYDVYSSEEARHVAADNRLSFLRISKPEIGMPGGTDPTSPDVYAKGREVLDRFCREGVLMQDDRAGYYVYQQVMGSRCQTGWVGVASCEEYRQGIVRRHEVTRPDKEDDRVRHIEVLEAQTGPAFLAYRHSHQLDELMATVTGGPPAVDFVAADGIRHRAWSVFDASLIERVRLGFAGVERLYIADGHHRTAAAARVDAARSGRGGADRFLAVIFPHDHLQIFPYHRVLRDLNGNSAEGLVHRLESLMRIEATSAGAPRSRHEVFLYLEGKWLRLRFREEDLAGLAGVERLDVALLQRLILEPLFGVRDPRTHSRIEFVGGIRGMVELERWVNEGRAACAFAMYPTAIEELLSVADGGGIMPPKSTWFEPKLRDGMFCHMLRE